MSATFEEMLEDYVKAHLGIGHDNASHGQAVADAKAALMKYDADLREKTEWLTKRNRWLNDTNEQLDQERQRLEAKLQEKEAELEARPVLHCAECGGVLCHSMAPTQERVEKLQAELEEARSTIETARSIVNRLEEQIAIYEAKEPR